jgi:hypothetical protein
LYPIRSVSALALYSGLLLEEISQVRLEHAKGAITVAKGKTVSAPRTAPCIP